MQADKTIILKLRALLQASHAKNPQKYIQVKLKEVHLFFLTKYTLERKNYKHKKGEMSWHLVSETLLFYFYDIILL